jgi:hypothetical protein
LAGLHEADGARGDEQLGLQRRLLGDDLELQALRMRVLADRSLQRRYPSRDRSADDISSAALDFGDADC